MDFTRIPTPYGEINTVRRSPANNTTTSNTILFIHSNSASWRMFKHLLSSDRLASKYTLIAFDLPGHGASADAPPESPPGQTYTFAGYASAAIAVLQHYNTTSAVLYGTSLGGHVAVDMAMQLAETDTTATTIKVRGVMTSGSPLCRGLDEAMEGFNLDPDDDNLAAAGSLSGDQMDAFVRLGYGGEEELWMREAARRTDARARPSMFAGVVRGDGRDHRGFVRDTIAFPLAVVNGAGDVLCKADVFERMEYGNLWRGRVLRIEGSGHTPCWDQPAVFIPLFEEFVDECFA